jgi:hypothetical protein
MCCGREILRLRFATWSAADEFRHNYTTIPEDGHTRFAILARLEEGVPSEC